MTRTVNYEVRINEEPFAGFPTLREARAYVKSAEFLEQANQQYGYTYGVQIISVVTVLKELTVFTVDGSNEEDQFIDSTQVIEGDNNVQINGDVLIDTDEGYENA